jgi:tungstate transport system permease protein
MANSLSSAFHLLVAGDRELYGIIAASLRFALLSVAIASVGAVPLGTLLALRQFPGKRLVMVLLHAALALPTVVVGLVVYSALSRRGPLGGAGLLFTPAAVIAGQTILAFPLVASMVQGALAHFDRSLHETFVTLGAGRGRVLMSVLREARLGVAGAALGGFGRVVGEVGVAMMLGGNIRFYTRTMTTAIALETGKGEFERALALGMVLMLIALAVNAAVHGTVRRGD